MKILLIGGLGRIGRRYESIFRHLGHDVIIYDQNEAGRPLADYVFDRVLIASPTETHYKYAKECIDLKVPYLVEKPLSMSEQECEELTEMDHGKGRVVCNYKYTKCGRYENPLIRYNYFQTGPHGLMWDCCQLIHLDRHAKLSNTSPIFQLTVNGEEVTLKDVELSYIQMILHWYNNDNLWRIKDGMNMTRKVLERYENLGAGPQ